MLRILLQRFARYLNRELPEVSRHYHSLFGMGRVTGTSPGATGLTRKSGRRFLGVARKIRAIFT
jgi:hypothetical protein